MREEVAATYEQPTITASGGQVDQPGKGHRSRTQCDFLSESHNADDHFYSKATGMEAPDVAQVAVVLLATQHLDSWVEVV